ncbi:MAG: DUF5668 domain-containing protein [Bacteroidales bacterium]
MKSSNLFWGVVLIIIGTVIFVGNFGILDISFWSILRLWPLLFIFWGIAILPIHAGMRLLLSFIALALGIVLLTTHPGERWFWNIPVHVDVGHDDIDRSGDWFEEDFDEPFNATPYALLDLDAAAGSFVVSGTTDQLFRFRTEGNVGNSKVSASQLDDSTTKVRFRQDDFEVRRKLKNNVRISLNPEPVWSFRADAGASELDMDLAEFKVKKIDIDGGASAIELTLGELYPETQINIDAGAASIKIRVPESSAVEVTTETILTGRDLVGFVKIGTGHYQTPNFSDQAHKIYIHIEAAVSGITVERY